MHLTDRLQRETGRDYALRMIKDNIVRLELKPGSMVSENELAKEMGLSRTPVREALIELSKVKIVEIYPQKGSVVSLIDYAMVDESQFMRNVLECAIAELDCRMATQEDIQKLRESLSLQQYYVKSDDTDAAFLEMDNQFHRMLFDIAKKPQVYTLMRSISIHFDRVRKLTLDDVKTVNVFHDHEQIVDAIVNKNEENARTCMQRHLNRFRIVEKQVREEYPQYFK
jgi:DNA-binding GntR family transcriptional regulator